MCQECVDTGRMTQDELDQRILAGDTNVMPMMDLPAEKIAEELTAMVLRGELTYLEAAMVAVEIGLERQAENRS